MVSNCEFLNRIGSSATYLCVCEANKEKNCTEAHSEQIKIEIILVFGARDKIVVTMCQKLSEINSSLKYVLEESNL